LLNAHRKARAVAKQHPDCLVLGADTIVCLGTRVFGKPKDMGDAAATLQALSGQTHEVMTGVSLIHHRLHREHLFADTTRVTFRRLEPGDIRAYLVKIQPMDKAGAYAIQEYGEMIVSDLDGSINNVIGLPTEVLGRVLESW
ncbi:MAG TPA: Maf family protein, partial [Roseimicrobium sp.]|nr:Maf family protein [Roseimicrobium sp.]